MNRKLNTEEIVRVSADEFKLLSKTPLVVVLDDIRSMHNIGSIFRTCDAFCIEKIFLCGITAVPPNNEIHKSALGAEFSVEWEYFESSDMAVKQLIDDGYIVYSIEQTENSIMLNAIDVDKDRKYAIVLGNEVFGVSQTTIDLCCGTIEIPQLGTKHSLNVSVAGGLAIWEFFNKLR
ncbi:MAG: RNA methyltransferase [Bacteroidales bacterium]|nr:MAG: RNA methyltransferase [Bacteroidales bacterium]